ncbi:MAG TPA: hypothetical protein VGO92_05425, partial [Acidimicrobiales bacterium]|nr:hypothetical protein [Acidimicrobiales bacterium]
MTMTESSSSLVQQFRFEVVYRPTAAGGIDTVWTQPNSNREVRDRHMVKTADGLAGTYLVGDAGEWLACDWRPPPLLVPHTLDLQRTWAIDSACDHAEGTRQLHEHLTGTLKITGTRQATVDGRPHTVWVVHREWRMDTTEAKSSSKSYETMTADAWWAPQLREFVKETVDGVMYF